IDLDAAGVAGVNTELSAYPSPVEVVSLRSGRRDRTREGDVASGPDADEPTEATGSLGGEIDGPGAARDDGSIAAEEEVAVDIELPAVTSAQRNGCPDRHGARG